MVERLRQVLGSGERPYRPTLGLQAKDLPGLYVQVAPGGAILGASGALAEAFGAATPAQLLGRPIASYLPEAAPGSALLQELQEKGELRDAPIRLTVPGGETGRAALLSARSDGADRGVPCAWTGCVVMPSAVSSPAPSLGERFYATPTGADWDFLDEARAGIQALADSLALQSPPFGAEEARPSLLAALRLYSVFLPRLDALLALNTPPTRHEFDARDAVASLCRASAPVLRGAGIDLIFDAQPDFPARVTACERTLTLCVRLLLGAASAADGVREIVAQIAIEDRRCLSVGFLVQTSGGAPGEQHARQIELASRLAATADATIAVELAPPESTKYVLRMGVETLNGVLPQAGGLAAKVVNPALQALRVLIVGAGEGRSAVLAGWMRRQRAEVTLAPSMLDVTRACHGVRPDIAILELAGCPELPEFLCEVPVLGLRTSSVPPAGWRQTSIEMPVLEEDLLDAVNALLARLDAPAMEPRQSECEDAVRILAVEDNLVNQRVIQKMIAKLGYEIDVAGNGLEALAAIRKRAYDAVLMDWEMPIMDGLETTSVIRQFPEPLCLLPIIAVTAHAMPGDRETCLGGGMNDYLSKPVNVEMLHNAIEKWLPLSPRRLRVNQ
ncbi:MAG: response regulator [Bryobacteraceae bacterium]|nr:response regulator [Bryobacteraceae bacterium]